MDYTTRARVKDEILAAATGQDALIDLLVSAASLAADRHCAGSQEAVDFFKLETVTDEILLGQVDVRGRISLWPHKSRIVSVSALAYRSSPLVAWTDVSPSVAEVQPGSRQVIAWTSLKRAQVTLKVTYRGGHAEDTAHLPGDLVEAVTVMAARYFKEGMVGLSDAIGVAELGTLIYSKAMPTRVRNLLKPVVRPVSW